MTAALHTHLQAACATLGLPLERHGALTIVRALARATEGAAADSVGVAALAAALC
jgi:hypothetical protein